jgi:hypothetical protein
LLSAYSQFSPFTIPVEPLPTAQDESVMQKVMTKKSADHRSYTRC